MARRRLACLALLAGADGALDFLWEGSGANSESLCLYLSRGAPPGKLVREAGCLDSIGC